MQNVLLIDLAYLYKKTKDLLLFVYSYTFNIIGGMASINKTYSLNLVDMTSDQIAIQ
jgi:hypothetical protein